MVPGRKESTWIPDYPGKGWFAYPAALKLMGTLHCRTFGHMNEKRSAQTLDASDPFATRKTNLTWC
jgi:hypothetical protein